MNLVDTRCPVARKTHTCEHCFQTIPVGMKYQRQFCVDGGDVWSFISHIDCHDMACHLAKMDGLDWEDGVPTLADYENDTGYFPDFLRGHFPHPVCRLELRKQKRDAAQRDTAVTTIPFRGEVKAR